MTPDLVRDEWVSDRETLVKTVLARAAQRGEIDPARVTPRTLRLPSDLLDYQVLSTVPPASDEWIVQVVELVLPVFAATGSPYASA